MVIFKQHYCCFRIECVQVLNFTSRLLTLPERLVRFNYIKISLVMYILEELVFLVVDILLELQVVFILVLAKLKQHSYALITENVTL